MDKIIFYRDWMTALDVLPLEERCLVYEAIMKYAFDGTLPDDKYLNVVTALMRIKVDKDKKAYAEVCNMRAEVGKRGGLKSGESRRRNSKRNNPAAGEANATVNAVNAPKANRSNLKQTEANRSNLKQTEADESNVRHGEAKPGDEAKIEMKGAVDGLSSLCRKDENKRDLKLGDRDLKLGKSDSVIANRLKNSFMAQSGDASLKQNEANGSNAKQNEHNSNSKYNCKYKYNDKEDKSSSSSSSTTARARVEAVAEDLKGSLEELKKSPIWKESVMKKFRIAGGQVDLKLDEFYRDMVCRGIAVKKPAVFFTNWLAENLNNEKQSGGEKSCRSQNRYMQNNRNISYGKSNNYNYGTERQDKFQQRRGTDAYAWTEEDFEEAF